MLQRAGNKTSIMPLQKGLKISSSLVLCLEHWPSYVCRCIGACILPFGNFYWNLSILVVETNIGKEQTTQQTTQRLCFARYKFLPPMNTSQDMIIHSNTYLH